MGFGSGPDDEEEQENPVTTLVSGNRGDAGEDAANLGSTLPPFIASAQSPSDAQWSQQAPTDSQDQGDAQHTSQEDRAVEQLARMPNLSPLKGIDPPSSISGVDPGRNELTQSANQPSAPSPAEDAYLNAMPQPGTNVLQWPQGGSAPAQQPTPTAAISGKAPVFPTYTPVQEDANRPQLLQGIQTDKNAVNKLSPALNRDDYKPGIAKRILGSLFTGMMTYGKVPNAQQIGEDAIWSKYNNAEADRQTNLKAAQEKLAQDTGTLNEEDQNWNRASQRNDQNYNAQVNAYNRYQQAQTSAANEEAKRNQIISFTPDDINNPYAGGTGVTTDGRTVKGIAPPDKWIAAWEKDPTHQALKGVATIKALKAAGIPLTAEQEAIIGSGGHPSTSVHTNISIRENPDGSAVTPRGRGSKSPSGIDDLIAKNIQDKDTWASQWVRNPEDGSYTNSNGQTISGQQFNQRIEKFRTDLNANAAMRKAGVTVDARGNVQYRNGRSGRAAQPQQHPAAQQQTAHSNLPQGNGRTLDANTARQFLKAARGNKNTARQLAAQNKWKF